MQEPFSTSCVFVISHKVGKPIYYKESRLCKWKSKNHVCVDMSRLL